MVLLEHYAKNRELFQEDRIFALVRPMGYEKIYKKNIRSFLIKDNDKKNGFFGTGTLNLHYYE